MKKKPNTDKSQDDTKTTNAKKGTTAVRIPVASSESFDVESTPVVLKKTPVVLKKLSKPEQFLEITELLLGGMSVRDVADAGFPKSTVEKISRRIHKGLKKNRKESSVSPQKTWMQKPYSDALEEKESEGILGSGWLQRTYRSLLRTKIEIQMMKGMGLLGGDGGGNPSRRGNSPIDINAILMAKVVSGGGNMTGQELTSFAASLKDLFTPQPQSDDFMQKYTKVKELENTAIQKFAEVEQQAYARAKSQGNTDFLKDVIGKGVEVASNFMSPKISGNALSAPSPLPKPKVLSQQLTPQQLDALEAVTLPSSELPKSSPASLEIPNQKSPVVDDSLTGYNNLNSPFKNSTKEVK